MKLLVLVIEDEETMSELLVDNLRAEGYLVEMANDGKVGLQKWQDLKPNLVVLDVMLSYLNGFELCTQMRKQGDNTPVLFLSAKGETQDRIKGLSVGGDDYLPKPFDLKEFLLRVKNMLKRQGLTQNITSVTFAGHTVNFHNYTTKLASGKEELLTEYELKIFKLLFEHANEIVSRDDILDNIWKEEVFPSTHTLNNFIERLRKLFEPNPHKPIYFHTIWGVGYKFTPESSQTTI